MSLREELTEEDILIDEEPTSEGESSEDGEESEDKALESKTVLDILQRVSEGTLSASAAMSMVKSLGSMSDDVRQAILAQDVIGRELRRTGAERDTSD